MKIESSYASFRKAFDLLYQNRDGDEELQYMITGSDFVADLLAFLNILEPVVDLMLRVQSLDTPIWNLKLWWPVCGDATAFPRLEKGQDVNTERSHCWRVVCDVG
jgi:hypothetical protein